MVVAPAGTVVTSALVVVFLGAAAVVVGGPTMVTDPASTEAEVAPLTVCETVSLCVPEARGELDVTEKDPPLSTVAVPTRMPSEKSLIVAPG